MALATGVDTTALTVADMSRALGFYRDLLGMEVVETKGADSDWSPEEEARWHIYHETVCGIPGARIQAVFLRAVDGTHLELIEYKQPRVDPSPRRRLSDPGVAIVPFACNDSAAVVEKLRTAGVEVIHDPVRYVLNGVTSYTTYLYDPDGNALCLFEVVDKSS
ncbi:Glyoxalase/Bleomycin resistance protein/Dioxygenase [Gaiella occulta]|uniref:Glyoxalase/Bleomycin resistance protein/Dioxygenase n=1 Tax=Gaiella occulta TaxID=1002870 RepID=A0A7M2YUU8_9ACTN|nr:VOC family protein [Gaiella occulta]RDI73634.1 Glyoxalase/Bleomycin resistance protein/Dioxygenase [Gaiella occulta]